MRHLLVIDPSSMIGCTYLTPEENNGTQYCVRIVEQIKETYEALMNHPDMIKFRAISSNGQVEDIQTYRQLLDKLEEPNGTDDQWHFKSIDDHQGW